MDPFRTRDHTLFLGRIDGGVHSVALRALWVHARPSRNGVRIIYRGPHSVDAPREHRAPEERNRGTDTIISTEDIAAGARPLLRPARPVARTSLQPSLAKCQRGAERGNPSPTVRARRHTSRDRPDGLRAATSDDDARLHRRVDRSSNSSRTRAPQGDPSAPEREVRQALPYQGGS